MPRVIKASTSDIIWKTAKIIILITVAAFLYFKLKDNQQMAAVTWQKFVMVFQQHYFILGLVIFLMGVNWSLEAIKWQILVSAKAKINFLQALRGVLLGLSFSFISPHGIGDYAGRILPVRTKGKEELLGAVMLSRISQMIPTLCFGMVGVHYVLLQNVNLYVISLFTLALIGVVLLFRKKVFHSVFRRIHLEPYFGIIGAYANYTILLILGLSVVRYITFTVQFVIILFLFQPGLPLHLNAAGVTWIFLAKSVLPTFNFLSDLGVREVSAIYFFEQFATDLTSVVGASLALWCINIMVPTIIATPLVLKLKFSTS